MGVMIRLEVPRSDGSIAVPLCFPFAQVWTGWSRMMHVESPSTWRLLLCSVLSPIVCGHVPKVQRYRDTMFDSVLLVQKYNQMMKATPWERSSTV